MTRCFGGKFFQRLFCSFAEPAPSLHSKRGHRASASCWIAVHFGCLCFARCCAVFLARTGLIRCGHRMPDGDIDKYILDGHPAKGPYV